MYESSRHPVYCVLVECGGPPRINFSFYCYDKMLGSVTLRKELFSLAVWEGAMHPGGEEMAELMAACSSGGRAVRRQGSKAACLSASWTTDIDLKWQRPITIRSYLDATHFFLLEPSPAPHKGSTISPQKCLQLGTKCLDIWACGRHFITKP